MHALNHITAKGNVGLWDDQLKLQYGWGGFDKALYTAQWNT